MRNTLTVRTLISTFLLIGLVLSPVAWMPGGVAHAQNPNGRLVVTVKDQSDAVISGAKVVVLNTGTAEEASVESNDSGVATFPQLSPGFYTVTVEAESFQRGVFEAVKIEVGKDYGLIAQLTPGAITESVTVTAGESIISTTNAELTTTVTARQVQELPLDGRNPLDLIQLQAGVSLDNGRAGVTINGQRSSSGLITQDGITVQDYAVRTNALTFSPNRTTVSGVSEFSVTTQNAGSDTAGASAIRIVTPSGTNDLHGEVFEYHRNDALGANDFFNNMNDIEKPQLIRNQFGFAVGGPVYIPGAYDGRNKFFFFGSYEGFRQRTSVPFNTTVLTQEARQGLFRYRDTSGNLRTVNLLNQLNIGIDPVASQFLGRMPLPNSDLAGDGLNTAGYSFNKRTPTNRNQGTARLDYVINDRHKLEGVYQYTGEINRRADIDGTFNQLAQGFDTSATHFAVAAWNWQVNDRLQNEVRVGLNNSDALFGVDEDNPFGYIAVFPLTTDSQINFDPQLRRTIVSSFIDDASYIAGDHFLRFGTRVDLVRLRNNKSFTLTPRITIGLGTAAPSALLIRSLPGGTPTNVSDANGLTATLGGFITDAQREYNVADPTNPVFSPTTQLQENALNQYAVYLQDTWRIHPRVTLNLGLRWDYTSPLYETRNLGLVPTGNGGIASAIDPNGSLDFVNGFYYQPDKTNFAPNISAAWDVFGDGRTVVRGGFSLAYINDETVRATQLVAETNPGLNTTVGAGSTFGSLSGDLNQILNGVLAPPDVQLPLSFAEARNQNNQVFFASIDPDLQTPYYQQWNLSIEREIGWDTAVAARYVGTRGRKLLSNLNYNEVNVLGNGFANDVAIARQNGLLAQQAGGSFDPRYNPNIRGSRPLTVFPTIQAGGLLTNPTVQTLIAQGRAADLADIYFRLQFGGSEIFAANPNAYFSLVLGNDAYSDYNALQLEVRRRFSKSLGFQANYTWSKAYGFGVGTQQQRQDFPFDVNNLNYDRRRLLYDTTHNFKTNVTYDLPFGDGQRFDPDNAVLEGLAGGWTVTSIVSWYTGAPISVNSSYGTVSTAQTQVDTSLTHEEISNLLGVYDGPDGPYYFDPSLIGPDGTAVSLDPFNPFTGQKFFIPGPGQYGSLQFLQFNAPTVFNWDASVIKNVPITENVKAQLRFEFFNVLNHPIFFISSQSVTSRTFGKITQTLNAPRVVQVAFKLSF